MRSCVISVAWGWNWSSRVIESCRQDLDDIGFQGHFLLVCLDIFFGLTKIQKWVRVDESVKTTYAIVVLEI